MASPAGNFPGISRFRRENTNHQRLRLAEQRLENETERQRNRDRLQQDMVGRVTPCAPPQLQQNRRAPSDAPNPDRTVDCGLIPANFD